MDRDIELAHFINVRVKQICLVCLCKRAQREATEEGEGQQACPMMPRSEGNLNACINQVARSNN